MSPTAPANSGTGSSPWILLWLVAQRCYWSAPQEEARAAVLESAARLGSIVSDLRLLATVAYVAPLERGREVLAAIARTPLDLEADPEAARLVGTAAAVVGSFAMAAPALATAAAGLRARGRLGHLARVLVLEGWAASHLANWSLAVPAAEEARAFSAEAAEPLWEAGAKVVHALIAASRGDAEDVDRYTGEVERIALPAGVNFLLAAVQLARGTSALGSGRHSEAFEHLRRLFDGSDPAHHPLIATLAIGDLAEAARQCGGEEVALRSSAISDSIEELAASPRLHHGLRLARALLADDGEAEGLYQLALDVGSVGMAGRPRAGPPGLRVMASSQASRRRVTRSAARGPRRVRRARRRRVG